MKTKNITDGRIKDPWITKAVLNLIKIKNKLYRDFKIRVISKEYYKKYHNALNSITKKAKKSYHMPVFTCFKIETSKIWSKIDELKNNFGKPQSSSIYQNNIKLTHPLQTLKQMLR